MRKCLLAAYSSQGVEFEESFHQVQSLVSKSAVDFVFKANFSEFGKLKAEAFVVLEIRPGLEIWSAKELKNLDKLFGI